MHATASPLHRRGRQRQRAGHDGGCSQPGPGSTQENASLPRQEHTLASTCQAGPTHRGFLEEVLAKKKSVVLGRSVLLLLSREAVCVPRLACEMTAYDPTSVS